MVPRLFFGPFTTWGTLNNILPVRIFVAQSIEVRETSVTFSCTLRKELFASKSNLSIAFFKSSISYFRMEHFNATDVTFHEIRVAWVFKFSI
jgi:hypothetical protein